MYSRVVTYHWFQLSLAAGTASTRCWERVVWVPGHARQTVEQRLQVCNSIPAATSITVSHSIYLLRTKEQRLRGAGGRQGWRGQLLFVVLDMRAGGVCAVDVCRCGCCVGCCK